MTMNNQACADDWVQVSSDNLPLACPMPHQTVQHAHPRVYLPIEKSGKAKCYYCGTLYVLKDFSSEVREQDA